jgi:integrase
MFLRYLIAEGKSPPGLDAAIPTVANWQLSALPRYLSSPDVERVIKSCDCSTKTGLRDLAIILLLARLGLRSSDVAALRLSDVDWREASIRVSGKGRRAVCLPLTQEVGDAILKYLECGRPCCIRSPFYSGKGALTSFCRCQCSVCHRISSNPPLGRQYTFSRLSRLASFRRHWNAAPGSVTPGHQHYPSPSSS